MFIVDGHMGRLNFLTQFKIEFLLPFTDCRTVLGKISAYKARIAIFYQFTIIFIFFIMDLLKLLLLVAWYHIFERRNKTFFKYSLLII